jgi:hypothetical protein
MIKKILYRLQSPVVIIQLISIVGGAIVLLNPDVAELVKVIVGTLVAIISTIAGINNPADRKAL